MKGVDMISSVMGPPGKGDPMDSTESDEGLPDELEMHLKAFAKAPAGSKAQADAFKAAVQACNGSMEE